jgi:hypothetical protein
MKLATHVLPGNHDLDSPDNLNPPYDFKFIHDCGHAILNGEFKIIEDLVSRSPSKYGSQNGKFLDELEGRVIYLSDLNEQLAAFFRSSAPDDDRFIEPAGPNSWEGATQVVPLFFNYGPSLPQPIPDRMSVREAAQFYLDSVCAGHWTAAQARFSQDSGIKGHPV